MRFAAAAFVVSICAFGQTDAPIVRKPFDVDAMMRIARVSEPQISPDGKLVAFTVERPDCSYDRRQQPASTLDT
jgi:hypothetical protein